MKILFNVPLERNFTAFTEKSNPKPPKSCLMKEKSSLLSLLFLPDDLTGPVLKKSCLETPAMSCRTSCFCFFGGLLPPQLFWRKHVTRVGYCLSFFKTTPDTVINPTFMLFAVLCFAVLLPVFPVSVMCSLQVYRSCERVSLGKRSEFSPDLSEKCCFDVREGQ